MKKSNFLPRESFSHAMCCFQFFLKRHIHIATSRKDYLKNVSVSVSVSLTHTPPPLPPSLPPHTTSPPSSHLLPSLPSSLLTLPPSLFTPTPLPPFLPLHTTSPPSSHHLPSLPPASLFTLHPLPLHTTSHLPPSSLPLPPSLLPSYSLTHY